MHVPRDLKERHAALAGYLRELAATRYGDHPGTGLVSLLDAVEGLFGVPGIADREYQRVTADVRGKLIAFDSEHGYLEAGQRRERADNIT